MYGGQKSEIFPNFFLCSEMIPKGFPHHLCHLFHPNSTEFTQFGPLFEAYMVAFSCVLATPCSENLDFLEKKIDPKRLPESSKRLPTPSKPLFPGPTVHSSELAPPSGPKHRIHESECALELFGPEARVRDLSIRPSPLLIPPSYTPFLPPFYPPLLSPFLPLPPITPPFPTFFTRTL